jgi:undecaprenyl diphosphate synthase
MNPINHVAIIMDGNGRWGLKNKNSRNEGHKAGLISLEKIIRQTINQKIKYLTLYVFSTENWKRPKEEINFLFNLLENFLKNKIDDLHKKNIKLKVVEKKKRFSKKLNFLLNSSEKKTYKNNKLQLNLALNYGSKNELIQSLKSIIKKGIKINDENIQNNLYTKNIPNPDILIRTGGTNRLSNFLLWQIAYSEIFFVKKMWPDFNEKDYLKILKKFKITKRNFGNI